MKSEKQGYFTLEEWRRGLKALRADTISKLKKALPELEKEVSRPQNFLDFYSCSFRYCLTGMNAPDGPMQYRINGHVPDNARNVHCKKTH